MTLVGDFVLQFHHQLRWYPVLQRLLQVTDDVPATRLRFQVPPLAAVAQRLFTVLAPARGRIAGTQLASTDFYLP